MDKIIEQATEFPAAIFIKDDLRRFQEPECIGYEIGVQQPRQHRRFANFFRHGDALMMYFKHDKSVVAELYARFPGVILPSEIAGKYWSKLLVEKEPAIAIQLLENSYRLICESATKQGRLKIENLSQEPNRFSTFHSAAMELSQLENVYLKYNDYEEPSVSVGIHAVAKFSWNQLYIRSIVGHHIENNWEVLESARHKEWPNALRSAVEHG